MRTGVSNDISASDRLRLEAVVRDRNAAQKHVWRAAIVLLSGDGIGTHEIMRQTGTSKTCVWRWQERFAEEGVDGLLHDKTRPSHLAPLSPEVAARMVGLTLEAPPGETTHWTAAAMATATAISVGSVQRIWRKHGLQPHRIRTFRLSNDKQFAEKLRDVVGLYVDPPAHAVLLSFDEKSQIQALDRTQPGLPLKKGRCGTMTHDYKPPALHLPLYADIGFMAQCYRGLLRHPDQAAHQARCLLLDHRSPGRHQPLHRRAQSQPKAVRLDQGPRKNHRSRQTRAPSVGFYPLAIVTPA
jgi:transposase